MTLVSITQFTRQFGQKMYQKFEFPSFTGKLWQFFKKTQFTSKSRIPRFEKDFFCPSWLVNFHMIKLKHDFTSVFWLQKISTNFQRTQICQFWLVNYDSIFKIKIYQPIPYLKSYQIVYCPISLVNYYFEFLIIIYQLIWAFSGFNGKL